MTREHFLHLKQQVSKDMNFQLPRDDLIMDFFLMRVGSSEHATKHGLLANGRANQLSTTRAKHPLVKQSREASYSSSLEGVESNDFKVLALVESNNYQCQTGR